METQTEMRFDEFCKRVDSSAEFGPVKAAIDATHKFDAATDTGQITRALLYVKRTIAFVKYPALKARQLIPVATDVPPGASQIARLMWDAVGQAKIIANHADDLPRVDARVTEEMTPVHTFGDAYGYSVIDLARAAMTGSPLNDQKARAARRGFEQSIEDIAALGATDEGLGGMLNNANVSIDAATGNWGGLTAVQVLADLARMSTNMITGTLGSEQGDTILLPPSTMAQIGQLPFSTLNGQTILSVFQQYNPFIRNVDSWIKLETAGAGGVKRAVIYRRDPEVLSLEIPLDFTQLPPEPRNLEFLVNCYGRIGGVRVMQPMAMRYMDGI